MKLTLYYRLYQLLKAGKYRYWAIRAAKALRQRYLLVRFDTNYLCNLKCPSCLFTNPDIAEETMPPIDLALYERIAGDIFPRTRFLFLSCGAEPTMSKNLDKFLDIARRYEVPYIGFATNGMLLKDRFIEACIGNRVNEVTFSLDGATKETYEKFKAGGKFETVLERIRRLNEMKAEKGVDYPAVRFNYTVNAENIGEMAEFVDLAKTVKAQTIKYRHLMNMEGEMDWDKYSVVNKKEEFNAMREETIRRGDEYAIEIIVPESFSLNAGEQPVRRKVDLREVCAVKYGCILPWYTMFIRPDGMHRPCVFQEWEGDFKTNTYAEYFNSRSMKERRKKLRSQPEDSCLYHVCQGQGLGSMHYESDLVDEEAVN